MENIYDLDPNKWKPGRGNKYLLFNEAEIRREIATKDPGIYGLRILMSDFYSTKLSAYFYSNDPDQVIKQMLEWRYPDNCTINFYLTINPVKQYCEAREQYYSLRKCRIMTQDEDIERLSWFAIDVDPEHPAGTSATLEEKHVALRQAGEVYHYMAGLGFSDPVIVDSGNGFHLKYKIDLPNNDETQEMLKALNASLCEQFPLVDKSVKNASRILKLPGTIAMKGRHTADRSYRPAHILDTHDFISRYTEVTEAEDAE